MHDIQLRLKNEIRRSDFPQVPERIRKDSQNYLLPDKLLDVVKALWTPGKVPVM
jgi:hypothetical protein